MTQDLQQLLEKIQRDGVDKAQSEKDSILAAANEQAKAIIEKAKNDSAKLLETARQDAAAFEQRAEETIRQAARDTVLKVEKAVTDLFTALLTKDVDATLNDADTVAALATEAVRAYLGGKDSLEIATTDKLAAALRAKAAALAAAGITVVTDEDTGSGFSVRLDGGHIEHTFTGAAVAESLAKQLRPRLAALMKP